jgi:hypothetical protein
VCDTVMFGTLLLICCSLHDVSLHFVFFDMSYSCALNPFCNVMAYMLLKIITLDAHLK